jgi:hypothetical protein
LSGYYVAVFSLIPCLALLLGPTAILLGTIGYRRYRAQPAIRGQYHAWVAIVLGAVTTLGNVGAIIALFASR